MLDQHHTNRRQLAHLMAAKPATRPLLILGELAPTATAPLRVMRDDLVNLILRDVCASRSRMPLLATSLPLGLATLGQKLLSLRARLRPPLLSRLRWILRR